MGANSRPEIVCPHCLGWTWNVVWCVHCFAFLNAPVDPAVEARRHTQREIELDRLAAERNQARRNARRHTGAYEAALKRALKL